MELQLAWRLFKRELMQGQLVLIVLAITLAVLSVSGLARVSERLQVAINGEAANFIAADRIIDSPVPLSEQVLTMAESLNIQHVTNMKFNSMVYSGDNFQLVTIKAVGDGYPLRGEIELSSGVTQGLPKTGEAWYENRLGGLLGYPNTLELGNTELNLSAEISRLPDAGFNPFASSPVLLMRLDDVEATGIIQPGSRVSYVYQFAGEAAALTQFETQAKPLLNNSQRWTDVQSGDSPIASAVKRAERFLLLASLLGIALACAAIGIAAQRYCQRHYDVVAMLKTFGASAKQIRMLFGAHLLLVTVVGIVLGLIGGVMLDLAINQFLPAEIAAYSPLFKTLVTWREYRIDQRIHVLCLPINATISHSTFAGASASIRRVTVWHVAPLAIEPWCDGLTGILIFKKHCVNYDRSAGGITFRCVTQCAWICDDPFRP